MKIKMMLILALLASFLGFGVNNVWAGGFQVEMIGNMSTGGSQISHWWYTGTNVTFSGIALPGASVDTDIDGVTASVTADESGNWTFSPGDLGVGDKSVSFNSGGSEIKFILTLGSENVDWDAVGGGGEETLLATGIGEISVLIIIGGIILMVMGGKMVFNANKE